MGILRDKGFLVEISDVLEMIFFFLNSSLVIKDLSVSFPVK